VLSAGAERLLTFTTGCVADEEGCVLNRILKLFSPSLKKLSSEKQARIAQSLFGLCAACGKDLGGHSRWRLASAIFDTQNGMANELAKLIRDRQWDQAAQFQDWRGDRNEREYYVVRCPNSPQVSLVTMVSTADMWSDDYIESTELLAAESSKDILRLAGNHWLPF